MEQFLLDPALPDVRVEFALAEAEIEQSAEWRAAAAKFHAIRVTLQEAAAHPEVFVGFSRLSPKDQVEWAVRAAVTDLAIRLHVAEGTIRAFDYDAGVLQQRLPRLWLWFRDGSVSVANARQAAALASDLPTQVWSRFEEQVVELVSV